MPKHKLHGSDYVKTLPGGMQNWNYEQSSNKIVCKLCVNGFDYSASNINFRVHQHIDSDRHKRQLSLNAKRQDALKFSDETSNKFFDHITEAFTSAAIPFHKLQCRKVKSLLETWSGQAAPDESTLRKNYLPKQFNKVISAIKEAVTGKNYYIMVDEANQNPW